MQNLPYFFLLLKKNVGLWVLITTGSFSKIDTSQLGYIRMSSHYMILKNYSLGNNYKFKKITALSSPGEISMEFTTSESKYTDSLKYYFGTDKIVVSMSGGYTINDSVVSNSNNMLEPIDIGLDRKVSVFLGRSGKNEYQISLMLHAKNYIEIRDRLLDSIRRADSAMYGLRGGPAPFVKRLVDSAMNLDWKTDRKLTESEQNDLVKRQINIVNKAIIGDSLYIEPYKLKFGWEQQLKQCDSLIKTGKKILQLTQGTPEAEIILGMGQSYELVNKIDSARIYYERALALHDQRINNIKKDGAYYSYELVCKARVLILLNRETEGRAILKELSENPRISASERKMYQKYFTSPRNEFLQNLNP